MNIKQIIGYELFNALAAATYVGIVTLFLSSINRIFGPQGGGPLAAMGILLILVISVATMDILTFGRSVLWYLGGRKKEAIGLVVATLAFLIVIAALVFVILAYATG